MCQNNTAHLRQITKNCMSLPFGIAPLSTGQPYLPCRGLSRFPQNAAWALVFLFPYYTGPAPRRNISRYAMVTDYHLVAGAMLERLCSQLQSAFPQAGFVPFTDNSPLREVSLAKAAGLGVVGDHGLLIHPVYGSYVFIGEIVTDLPLMPDLPSDGNCLGCGRCLDACPNHALSPSGITLELCRSHITQKKRDLTPFDEEQIRLGGFVWGCDICQDVCPMNHGVPLTPIAEFYHSSTAVITNENALPLLQYRAYNYRGKSVILRNLALVNGQPAEKSNAKQQK